MLTLNKLHKPNDSFTQYIMTISLGGIAFFVDISVFWFITFIIGWHYLLGASLGMICGFILSYAGSKLIIFPSSKAATLTEFYRFFIVFLGGLLINNILVWTMVEYLLFHALLAKILSTGVVSVWNFLMRKHFVFVFTYRENSSP